MGGECSTEGGSVGEPVWVIPLLGTMIVITATLEDELNRGERDVGSKSIFYWQRIMFPGFIAEGL